MVKTVGYQESDPNHRLHKFNMQVPFFDLKAQYEAIRDDIDLAVARVFSSGQFVGGQEIRLFEQAFVEKVGASHCIGVGNGTDALFVILKSLGIGPGDEVITPAWSWISSAETISLTGATPVLADVDPVYYTINPKVAERLITARTKAIVAVHLYGHPADLPLLKSICLENRIYLVEDCAQAHLASFEDHQVGTWGIASAFSFYPTKNLGAYGDGGCIITSDAHLAENMRRFANHGGLVKDEHLVEGMNSRLDSLQASILRAKLPFLEEWNTKRKNNARLYMDLLGSAADVVLPLTRENAEHVFHLFVIRTSFRDELKEFLFEREVETMIHYPLALPAEPPYKGRQHPGDVEVSNLLQQEVLSLPVYPEISEEQIIYVCQAILEFFDRKAFKVD